jgi:ATP-dependent Clp protease ATP-binding subunit ClpB
VRRRPYSVVLFDEIEKAHPDVWNVLLQVLDDGRLTDGQGHVVDFKNTIILMTSNIGSDLLAQGLKGKELEAAREQVLRRHFRPEFLNRLDGILNFHQLRREDMAQILEIQLGRVRQRLAARDMELEVTPKAREALLAERGYDPAFGARPLKRLVQQTRSPPTSSAASCARAARSSPTYNPTPTASPRSCSAPCPPPSPPDLASPHPRPPRSPRGGLS